MKGIRGLCQKTAIIDAALIGILFYLIYSLLLRDKLLKNNLSSSKHITSDGDNGEVRITGNNQISKEYELRLKTLDDVRTSECKSISYLESNQKVTLVTYFYDYQFYDLRVSLITALESEELIDEIIVINDGSTEKRILNEAIKYLKNLKISTKLLENEARKGTAHVLKRGMEEATNDAIVFLDSNVICNRGWLAPLLDQITKFPNSIAVPHFDKVANLFPLQYEAVKETYVAILQWNLHVVLKRHLNITDTSSPSLRPDIFAFKKSFLQSLGSVDDNFQLGGGELAELAIRIWSCGGSIAVVQCSRAGLFNFDRPFKITNGFNLRHLTGLWLLEKYPHIYSNMRPTKEHLKVVAERQQSIFSVKKCQNIQWYFETILKKRVQLDSKAVKIGNLKVDSGSCASVAADMKIDVVSCEDANLSEIKPMYFFQMTSDKKLISYEKCLTATSTAYIILEECRPHDSLQTWELTQDSKLVNAATRACATHVTDPNNNNPNRQIVMVQGCPNEKPDHERFKKWTFIPA